MNPYGVFTLAKTDNTKAEKLQWIWEKGPTPIHDRDEEYSALLTTIVTFPVYILKLC